MTDREENAAKAVRRLKRWPIALKYRIVEETFVHGDSVALVARRNNVNANQVFEWRKLYRQGRLLDRKAPSQAAPGHDLIRVGVIDHDGGIRPVPVSGYSDPAPDPVKIAASPQSRPPGIMEIELVGGIRVRVDSGFDEVLLLRVLAVVRKAA